MVKYIPDRLFDPSPYIKRATKKVKLPSGIIVPDSKREISNPALCKGDNALPVSDAILVIIDGACRDEGTRKAEAAYGTWFAKDSCYNDSGSDPEAEEQTIRLGEISAAVRALQTIEDNIPGIRCVVLMTDSNGLTDAISNDIWRWEWIPKKNEFRDENYRTVANSIAYKALQKKVLLFEEAGVKVQFWKVDSDNVRCAREMAYAAFSHDDDDDSNASEKENKTLGKPCYKYWINKAAKSPEARALAKEMNMDLPDKHTTGLKLLVMYAIRRLVLTGKDTEHNFDLLFGPGHAEGLAKIWEMARRSVLRSEMQKDGGKDKWFDGEVSPFLVRPRPATPAELSAVELHIAHMENR